ncbi:MAG: hypothetical protein ACL93V_03380 [Candidatus Electrothrix sp. YB6]
MDSRKDTVLPEQELSAQVQSPSVSDADRTPDALHPDDDKVAGNNIRRAYRL